MLMAKSWCFACNKPCIQHVAARCDHPTKHPSIAGVRNSSGQFLSTLTAECPPSLAARLVTHCAYKVKNDPQVGELRKPSILALHPSRLKVCDGAGMRSTADRSSHPLGTVAQAWLRWTEARSLIPKILAHVGCGNPEPPLSAQESEDAARIAFQAVSAPASAVKTSQEDGRQVRGGYFGRVWSRT